MKKLIIAGLGLFFLSCGSSKVTTPANQPLYEVLTQQKDSGGNIRFFEILTEANEIKMLESDSNLKKKIHPGDITKANFIILNMGEQPSSGYSISVKKVEETPTKIIITTQDNEPNAAEMTLSVISYPYTIVKINSKKEVSFQ